MKSLPTSVKAYKSTPLFVNETIPQGLLKNHSTKQGVWGLIQVTQGELEYSIEDATTHVLSVHKQGVVEPEVLHHIRPLGDVSFFVEFYK